MRGRLLGVEALESVRPLSLGVVVPFVAGSDCEEEASDVPVAGGVDDDGGVATGVLGLGSGLFLG